MCIYIYIYIYVYQRGRAPGSWFCRAGEPAPRKTY